MNTMRVSLDNLLREQDEPESPKGSLQHQRIRGGSVSMPLVYAKMLGPEPCGSAST